MVMKSFKSRRSRRREVAREAAAGSSPPESRRRLSNHSLGVDMRAPSAEHDAMARALCSDRDLWLIDALPTLLVEDSLATLNQEVVGAHNLHAQSLQAIDSLLNMDGRYLTSALIDDAIRWEFVARSTVDAYIAEIERREREVAERMH